LSVKNIIRSLKFFSILNDEEVDLLASMSTLQNYSEEYILHYEKKESNKLLFLTEGLAKAYKIDKHDNEIFLYYIHQNSLISPRSCHAQKNFNLWSIESSSLTRSPRSL
jgi:CRP/FNR family transcriptional regulator